MKIVADANIIEIESSFRELGELVLIPGRKISNADLVDAEALLKGQETGGFPKPKLAAWTIVARVLMNTDETITRE